MQQKIVVALKLQIIIDTFQLRFITFSFKKQHSVLIKRET